MRYDKGVSRLAPQHIHRAPERDLMPVPIQQSDMEAVFAVTDELGIHREAVTVPLAKRGDGGVKSLGSGQLQITLPEAQDAAEWAQVTLRGELAVLGYEALP